MNGKTDKCVARNDVSRGRGRTSDGVPVRAFGDFHARECVWHGACGSRVGAEVATGHHVACRARANNQYPLLIEIVDDEIFYRAIRLDQIKARSEKILHRNLRTIEDHFRSVRVGVAGECGLRGAIDRCASAGCDQQISRLNSEDVVGKTRITGGNVEHDSCRHRRDISRLVERVIERGTQASRTAVFGVSHDGAWKRRRIAIHQCHSRPIELAERAVIHLPNDVEKLAVGRLRLDRVQVVGIDRKRVSRVVHDRIEIICALRHRSAR